MNEKVIRVNIKTKRSNIRIRKKGAKWIFKALANENYVITVFKRKNFLFIKFSTNFLFSDFSITLTDISVSLNYQFHFVLPSSIFTEIPSLKVIKKRNATSLIPGRNRERKLKQKAHCPIDSGKSAHILASRRRQSMRRVREKRKWERARKKGALKWLEAHAKESQRGAQ